MQTSIFLAKLMGPVLALMGLIVLVHPTRVRTMARELMQGEAPIFISGIITLPVALAIVNTHNVWVADWPVIITVFGWLAIVAGVMRTALPGPTKSIGAAMIENTAVLAIPGVLMGALGLYLSYQGYLA